MLAVAAQLSGSRPVFAIAVLGGVFAVALLFDWRALLAGVVGLVLVEALVRRYLVNDVTLFFVKDTVLAVAYVKFGREWLRSAGTRARPSAVTLLLGVLAIMFVLQLANPVLPTPLVGVLGIHSWLWYMPLALLAAHAFATPREAVERLRAFALTSLPLAVLAVLQVHLPSLNDTYYADIHGKAAYSVGDKIIPDRSVATFASTGAYADYLVFAVVAMFALLIVSRGWRERALAALLFSGVVLALGGAGSRAPMIAIVVSFAAFVVVRHRLDDRTGLAALLTIAVVLATATLYPVLPGLYRAGPGGFSAESVKFRLSEHLDLGDEDPGEATGSPAAGGGQRAETGEGAGEEAGEEAGERQQGETRTKTLTRTRALVLFGRGVGLGTAGRQYLDPFVSDEELADTLALAGPEGGWRNVLWEFGYVGLAVFGVVFAGLGLVAWRAFARTDDDDVRALAAAGGYTLAVTAVLMVLATKLGVVNYTLFFWLFVGLAIAAARFARPEPAATAA